MPASSKKQAKTARIAYAYKHGKLSKDTEVTDTVKQMAKMSDDQLKDFMHEDIIKCLEELNEKLSFNSSVRKQPYYTFMLNEYKRILFGTDSIYDDINVPTGIQAQCLFQPGEIPLGKENPEDKYIYTTADFVKSHIGFLTTDAVQENPPFKRSRNGYVIKGLGLPPEICECIMYNNAEELFYRS